MRRITVQDIKENDPIYVISKAGRDTRTVTAGDVLLTLTSPNGQNHMIVVPKTFIPVCITEFAPTLMILNSISFRSATAKGLLDIIHPEDAKTELLKPESLKELERIRKVLGNVDFTPTETVTSAMEALEATTNIKANVRIQDIMLRTEIEDDERMALLRAEQSSMTKDDFDFIIATASDNSEMYKWAKSMR